MEYIVYFEPYLKVQRFKVITDHKALEAFTVIGNKNPQLERWSVRLAEFNYEVTFRPGRKNSAPDALSRAALQQVDDLVYVIGEAKDRHNWVKSYKVDGVKCAGMINVKNNLEVKGYKNVKIRDNTLMLDETNLLWHEYIRSGKDRKYRLVVPQSLIGEVLRLCHERVISLLKEQWLRWLIDFIGKIWVNIPYCIVEDV